MLDFIRKYVDLSDESYARFIANAKLLNFKAGEIFYEPGQPFFKMYFINEGIVRCYRLINGEEMTYHFYFKDEFCVDFYSYLTGEPCTFYYQALTDTDVYELSKEDLQFAMNTIPAIDRLGRFMAEQAYKSISERLRDMQVDSLETRYLKLLNRAPNLFHLIQQRYIATYLGVKPESFSRMKAKYFRSDK